MAFDPQDLVAYKEANRVVGDIQALLSEDVFSEFKVAVKSSAQVSMKLVTIEGVLFAPFGDDGVMEVPVGMVLKPDYPASPPYCRLIIPEGNVVVPGCPVVNTNGVVIAAAVPALSQWPDTDVAARSLIDVLLAIASECSTHLPFTPKEPQPEPEPQTRPQAEPEPEPTPAAIAEPEPQPETLVEPEPMQEPAPEPEVEPEPQHEVTQPEISPELEDELVTEHAPPVPEPQPEQPEPQPEIQADTCMEPEPEPEIQGESLPACEAENQDMETVTLEELEALNPTYDPAALEEGDYGEVVEEGSGGAQGADSIFDELAALSVPTAEIGPAAIEDAVAGIDEPESEPGNMGNELANEESALREPQGAVAPGNGVEITGDDMPHAGSSDDIFANADGSPLPQQGFAPVSAMPCTSPQDVPMASLNIPNAAGAAVTLPDMPKGQAAADNLNDIVAMTEGQIDDVMPPDTVCAGLQDAGTLMAAGPASNGSPVGTQNFAASDTSPSAAVGNLFNDADPFGAPQPSGLLGAQSALYVPFDQPRAQSADVFNGPGLLGAGVEQPRTRSTGDIFNELMGEGAKVQRAVHVDPVLRSDGVSAQGFSDVFPVDEGDADHNNEGLRRQLIDLLSERMARDLTVVAHSEETRLKQTQSRKEGWAMSMENIKQLLVVLEERKAAIDEAIPDIQIALRDAKIAEQKAVEFVNAPGRVFLDLMESDIPLHQQWLEVDALDKSLEDCIHGLEEALKQGALDANQFHRCCLEVGRRQFEARALQNKIIKLMSGVSDPVYSPPKPYNSPPVQAQRIPTPQPAAMMPGLPSISQSTIPQDGLDRLLEEFPDADPLLVKDVYTNTGCSLEQSREMLSQLT